MIQISKTNNRQFYVLNVRKQILTISENLKNRKNCLKNIIAQAKNFNTKFPLIVQDNTYIIPMVIQLWQDHRKVKLINAKTEKPRIPTRRKKR